MPEILKCPKILIDMYKWIVCNKIVTSFLFIRESKPVGDFETLALILDKK